MPVSRMARTYMPGMSRPSGLGTTARSVGAGAGVHAHARKLQLAGVGVAAAVFQLQGDGRFGLAAFLYAPARQVAFEAQHLGAGLCDIHIQRIEARDGGERGGLVAVTSAPGVTVEVVVRPEMGAFMRV